MSISVLLLKNHEFIQICWVRRYIYQNLAYYYVQCFSVYTIVHKILVFSRSGTYLAFDCKLYYTLLMICRLYGVVSYFDLQCLEAVRQRTIHLHMLR